MTLPSAGWYADPDNNQRSRWWNGTAWTDNYSDYQAEAQAPVVAAPAFPTAPAVAPAEAAPYAAAPYTGTPYSAAPAAAPVAPYDYSTSAAALVAPAGTQWSTLWIWFIVAIPVLGVFGIFSIDWNSLLTASSEEAMMSAIYTPLYFVTVVINIVLYGLGVLFAFLDVRELRRRGVPRPFHWAWAFLNNYWVYTIGRSVVVKRRTGSGMAPMWVAIAIGVASLIFFIVFFVSFFMAFAQYASGGLVY